MPITFTRGDATYPTGDGPKIIAHVCNDIGAWGRGFVKAVSARWPRPEAAYRNWHRDGPDFALGEVQMVRVGVEPDLWVANMIGQHGILRRGGDPPIRYDAVESCLSALAHAAQGASATVHMPRIGCGLAGGTWNQIEPIIIRTLVEAGINVTVYDPSPTGAYAAPGAGLTRPHVAARAGGSGAA